jgi:TolB-like protein/DNA-binding winged helix-turn-helix (wHTH) protein/Tfp pilus assembly protein PilF
MPEGKHFYEFGPYRLHPAERLLLRNNQTIPLAPKAFDTLLLLVENPGHLLTKDELMKHLWPETFVEDVNLAHNISAIRRALEGKNGGEQYIETVPKGGYRFTAETKKIVREPLSTPTQVSSLTALPVLEPVGSRWSVTRLGVTASATILVIAIALFLIPRIMKFPAKGALATPPATTAIRSIAVLPLVNLSSDPSQEYFSDGLTDELITRLAKIGSLQVISRTSVIGYKRSVKKAPDIGDELHVDSIVEGTVERVNDRVRIRVQLIRASTDQHIWAESYDREIKDVLQLESDLAREIAQQIGLRTSEQPTQIARERLVSPDAYENYLKGRYCWNQRTEKGFRNAISYFEQAIAKDPIYAQAYAGIADSYVLLGYYSSLPPQDAYPRAKAAARKALELDPMLGEAHTSLAGALQDFDWTWKEVEQEHKRAVELSPGYATAHQWYGNYLNMMGRFEEAQAQIRQARDLDPLSPIINCNVAWAYHLARNDDRALEEFQKTKDMDPNFYWAHLGLGRVYVAKKMYTEAISAFERAAELSGSNSMVLSELGHAYAMAGRQRDAYRILAKLEESSRHRYISAYDMGLVYVGLGQQEAAMDWFERAYREHCRSLQFSRVEPRLDPLRSHARFQELLKRLNL